LGRSELRLKCKHVEPRNISKFLENFLSHPRTCWGIEEEGNEVIVEADWRKLGIDKISLLQKLRKWMKEKHEGRKRRKLAKQDGKVIVGSGGDRYHKCLEADDGFKFPSCLAQIRLSTASVIPRDQAEMEGYAPCARCYKEARNLSTPIELEEASDE